MNLVSASRRVLLREGIEPGAGARDRHEDGERPSKLIDAQDVRPPEVDHDLSLQQSSLN